MAQPRSHEIPYTIRRSSRARRVRVNVHAHSGVEVVLPPRAPERAAAAAVSELRPWIEGRLEEAQRVLARIAARAGTVPYLGAHLELVPQRGRERVHRDGARLLVPDGDPRPALERFYRRAARREIAPRLDRATALAGSSYTALDIRVEPVAFSVSVLASATLARLPVPALALVLAQFTVEVEGSEKIRSPALVIV